MNSYLDIYQPCINNFKVIKIKTMHLKTNKLFLIYSNFQNVIFKHFYLISEVFKKMIKSNLLSMDEHEWFSPSPIYVLHVWLSLISLERMDLR